MSHVSQRTKPILPELPRQLMRIVMAVVTAAVIGCGSSTPSPTGATPNASAATPQAQSSPDQEVLKNNRQGRPGVAAETNAPSPKSPAKPSPEQLAKWGISDFEPLQLLACRDGFSDSFLQAMAVSPDGKQFVLGGTKLTLWNTIDSQPAVDLLADFKSDQIERPIRSVAISPDGKWLAAGDQKGMLRIWGLSDQREAVAIRAHDSHLTQLAFSPDSQTLATTSYSGEVRLWQTADGKKLKTLKMSDQEIKALVFLTNSLLASASSEVNVWNLETAAKETALTKGYVRGPALGLSSDRRWLAFNDSESKATLWDVEKSKSTDVVLQEASAHLIEFSRDGKWIATYSNDSNIRVFDAKTGTIVQIIDADGDRIADLRWLPQANALVVASEQGRARIWGTAETATALGIQPLELPALRPSAADAHRSMTSAQLQRVIDLRSFPRLPGAVAQWCDFGMCSYNTSASQQEAELFYRYLLGKTGWTETGKPSPSQPGLVFRKEGCELNVTLTPSVPGQNGSLQVSLQFAGNYDVRWLPKFSAIDSRSNWDSFSSTSYRTKAELTDVEVGLLKQFHEAGWTAYTRLNSSSHEEPDSRSISMVQGGSVLTVSIGHPADSTTELSVQTSINVLNKSLPIPPDSGLIELDTSTNLQLVANTKRDLTQTAEFFDTEMAAEGWLAREAGRHFKDDKAWLPYIRGQQDVLIRLVALPEGGTRIIVGDAERSSWQLQKLSPADKKKEKPGIEAADLTLPKDAAAIKYDVDQKQIEFEFTGVTPPKLGEQFVKQMEAAGWTREKSGVTSDEYVFITFSKEKAEIQLRARADTKKSTAMISGDGLLWTKPLPTAPVRISYATWLRREHKPATLDLLKDFADEMHTIPAGSTKSK